MTAIAKRDIPTMETYSGLYVDLSDPQPDQICLQDIAVGLANTCRFGGQVSRFYSVAEHSVRCAEEARSREYSRHYMLACLLHDAHEAYTGDLTAPLKYTIEATAGPVIHDLQRTLDTAIGRALGVLPEMFYMAPVKLVDDYMLFREAAGLKWSHGIGEHWGNTEQIEPLAAYGWSPAEAERRFIETYDRLTCVPRS